MLQDFLSTYLSALLVTAIASAWVGGWTAAVVATYLYAGPWWGSVILWGALTATLPAVWTAKRLSQNGK